MPGVAPSKDENGLSWVRVRFYLHDRKSGFAWCCKARYNMIEISIFYSVFWLLPSNINLDVLPVDFRMWPRIFLLHRPRYFELPSDRQLQPFAGGYFHRAAEQSLLQYNRHPMYRSKDCSA